MQVEYRKITGYDNYSISNTGLVRNDSTGKTLKPDITNGYHRVFLFLNNKGKRFSIHRLVADAFIPNPDNKTCVDHIDNNKLNNNLDDLRWCSLQENNRNRSICSKNTSGVKGVTLNKTNNKWRTQININGKNIHIGYYNTLEEAQAARQRVATENFGEFLNTCEKVPIININIENLNINN